MSYKLYSASLNPDDQRIHAQADSFQELIPKTRAVSGLSEDSFGVYDSSNDELLAIVLSDNRILDVPQDDPALDATKEEANLLEEFDKQLLALLETFSDRGVRQKVLALSASGNIYEWLEAS